MLTDTLTPPMAPVLSPTLEAMIREHLDPRAWGIPDGADPVAAVRARLESKWARIHQGDTLAFICDASYGQPWPLHLLTAGRSWLRVYPAEWAWFLETSWTTWNRPRLRAKPAHLTLVKILRRCGWADAGDHYVFPGEVRR